MIGDIYINFFLKKNKALVSGLTPVYLRISLSGHRVKISTRRHILPDQWNQVTQKMRGKSTEATLDLARIKRSLSVSSLQGNNLLIYLLSDVCEIYPTFLFNLFTFTQTAQWVIYIDSLIFLQVFDE